MKSPGFGSFVHLWGPVLASLWPGCVTIGRSLTLNIYLSIFSRVSLKHEVKW